MLNPAEGVEDCLIRCLKGRELIYSFLGRTYEKEVDEQLLKNYLVHKESFIKYGTMDDVDVNIREGFEQLHTYFNKIDEENLSEAVIELAMDYANLFLGLKYFREKKGIPHPSESVYTSGDMYQKEAVEASKTYLEAGLVKAENFGEPEDHVSLQLYFMGHLCRKAASFLKDKNFQELIKNLENQKKFLEEHLLKWVPKLASDVVENAETEFYRGIGRITKGFLAMEESVIKELIVQTEKIKCQIGGFSSFSIG
jgi:anaerobic sulfite reductase subunit A